MFCWETLSPGIHVDDIHHPPNPLLQTKHAPHGNMANSKLCSSSTQVKS